MVTQSEAQAPVAPHDIDAIADAGESRRAFLRHAWYEAGGAEHWAAARRPGGEPLAAFPLTSQRRGPATIRQVAGCYWPFRSVPLAPDAGEDELAQLLGDRSIRTALGRVWRWGPVYGDDPAARRIAAAARAAGWQVLEKPLGVCFELDLAALRERGEWPSRKTLRKNRWRKRRLAEAGEVACRFGTAADWTAADRDAMAEVEANCWLAALDGGGETKFRDPQQRRFWERCAEDPALSKMLFFSLMTIGGAPAAFTFGIEAGDARYYVANNYDERFARFGPGRVLLYDDFERAAERGVTRISWGSGDAGYKSEMGARPGPEIRDLLFVRGALLAALLAPLWRRR